MFFFNKPQITRKKNFAWQKKHYNPYQIKKSLNFKKKIEIALLAVSLSAIISVMIYHNFFHITNLEVKGLQRIKKQEFEDTVFGILKYKKFFIFPGQSYLFTNVKEVKNILKEKYPIESISVQKTFPNTLSIDLEEKISTIIYDNGKQYSYLDLQGNIVEIVGNVYDNEWFEKTKITTTTLADGTIRTEKEVVDRLHTPDTERITAEFGHYPILYDLSDKKIEINQFILKPTIVSGIIEWFNFLNKKKDIYLTYIILDNGVGEGIIKTNNGWDIKVNLIDRINEQFDKFNLLFKDKIDITNLNYIDLRYQSRAYWK